MIVHIVFFQFNFENKIQNIEKTRILLESLKEKIDVIQEYQIGVNFDKASRAMDLSLYSTFNSVEELSTYANHPQHLKIVEFIKSVTQYTKVVDYKI